MPNQYDKIELTVESETPQNTLSLKTLYTKALFELLKSKIPHNTLFVQELINTISEELD
jgi:hypothetical protein